MFTLPKQISSKNFNRKQVIEFKGLNMRPQIEDGQMRAMKNLTASEYPYLYQRALRGQICTSEHDVIQMISTEKSIFMLTKADNLMYLCRWKAGRNYFETIDSLDYASNANMVLINNSICIFPNNLVYYFDEDEVIQGSETAYIRMYMVIRPVGMSQEVDQPQAYAYQHNKSLTSGYQIRYYTNTDDNYDRLIICDTYGQTSASGSGFGSGFNAFQEGDVIHIRNGEYEPNNIDVQIQKISEDGQILYVGSSSFTMPDDDEKTEIGITTAEDDRGTYYVSSTAITLARKSPDIDIVIERDNRLWGVGNTDNTIYSSKLGDPLNWYFYQDTTLDSYALEVGSQGDFTGIASYGSSLLFFKENGMTRLVGSYPAQYQTANYELHGVQKGCEKSIAVINNIVYYKARIGIMAYAGSTPALVSEEFHGKLFYDAVAGTDKDRYYVSMRDADNAWHMYCYNASSDMWHEEDSSQINSFVQWKQNLCFALSTKAVMTISYDSSICSSSESGPLEWMAQFGDFSEYIDEVKIYSRVSLQMRMEAGTDVRVELSVDRGKWTEVKHLKSDEERVVVVPVMPNRCDEFAIRLTGKGYCRIDSLIRKYRLGSDRK